MPDTVLFSRITFIAFLLLILLLGIACLLLELKKWGIFSKSPVQKVSATFLSSAKVEKPCLPSREERYPDAFRLTFWCDELDRLLEFTVEKDPDGFLEPGEDVSLTFQGDRFIRFNK